MLLAMTRRLLPYSEDGRIVGEGHPKARLTDAEVDRIRELHEEHGVGYRELSIMFNAPMNTIGYICRYERRIATAMDWRPAKKREAA
ncbi:MAG: hypothetical protein KA200_00195 [Burkholderiales bacterium]|nr:hypothetical protein [Burkholderiales bacterium]